MGLHIGWLTIDCKDPDGLARFWEQALPSKRTWNEDDEVAFASPVIVSSFNPRSITHSRTLRPDVPTGLLTRSGHALGLKPQGRLFPTSRDELVECAAVARLVMS